MGKQGAFHLSLKCSLCWGGTLRLFNSTRRQCESMLDVGQSPGVRAMRSFAPLERLDLQEICPPSLTLGLLA